MIYNKYVSESTQALNCPALCDADRSVDGNNPTGRDRHDDKPCRVVGQLRGAPITDSHRVTTTSLQRVSTTSSQGKRRGSRRIYRAINKK